jgi:hypothetical protein
MDAGVVVDLFMGTIILFATFPSLPHPLLSTVFRWNKLPFSFWSLQFAAVHLTEDHAISRIYALDANNFFYIRLKDNDLDKRCMNNQRYFIWWIVKASETLTQLYKWKFTSVTSIIINNHVSCANMRVSCINKVNRWLQLVEYLFITHKVPPSFSIHPCKSVSLFFSRVTHFRFRLISTYDIVKQYHYWRELNRR